MKYTAEQIRDIRASLGLTQIQLANSLSISARTLIRYENGTAECSPIVSQKLLFLSQKKQNQPLQDITNVDLDMYFWLLTEAKAKMSSFLESLSLSQKNILWQIPLSQKPSSMNIEVLLSEFRYALKNNENKEECKKISGKFSLLDSSVWLLVLQEIYDRQAQNINSKQLSDTIKITILDDFCRSALSMREFLQFNFDNIDFEFLVLCKEEEFKNYKYQNENIIITDFWLTGIESRHEKNQFTALDIIKEVRKNSDIPIFVISGDFESKALLENESNTHFLSKADSYDKIALEIEPFLPSTYRN